MNRGGKKRMDHLEVSRWLLHIQKKSAIIYNEMTKGEEEAPLVVPKVTKQYTRKKKVSPAEPDNKLVTPEVATICLEHNVSEVEVDKYNQVKIKVEHVPYIENYVQMKEPNVSQNNNETLNNKVEDHVEIKKGNLTEIKMISCSSTVKDKVGIKEEMLSKEIPINRKGIEKEQQKSRIDISVKIEPLDDSENSDLDQKYIAGYFVEEGKAVRTKPMTDEMDEGKDVELDILNEANVMGQKFQENMLRSNTLLTEEINIKEDIVIDNDDSELTVETNNIKEKPECDEAIAVQQIKTGITNGYQPQVTQGREGVLKRTKEPDITKLKKCYLVKVNVAPSTSITRRKVILKASSQKILDPASLAGAKVVAKSKIFSCNMCGEHFLSKASVHQHACRTHGVATRFKCPCGEKFTHNYLLLAHKRAHSVSGPLACDLCPKRFKSTPKYANHLNTHLRERFFSCPVCGRRDPVLCDLRRHAVRHKSTDIYQCNRCSAWYRCITDLRRHSERDHSDKVDYPCYVCNRTLSSNAEFVAHVKSHDNTLHACAFCSKKFNDFQKWEEHSAAHIERLDALAPLMLPYVCEVCRKRFEFRCLLKAHMRNHSQERPYKCKECSKKFKTRGAVTEHEKGHSRPYPCPECPARFAKRFSLTQHVLVHSGERPHKCPSCPRAFTQRFVMLRHVQRFHTPGLKRAKTVKRKPKCAG